MSPVSRQLYLLEGAIKQKLDRHWRSLADRSSGPQDLVVSKPLRSFSIPADEKSRGFIFGCCQGRFGMGSEFLGLKTDVNCLFRMLAFSWLDVTVIPFSLQSDAMPTVSFRLDLI